MSDFGIITHLNEVNVAGSGRFFHDMLLAIYPEMNDLKDCFCEDDFYILGDMMVILSVKALVAVKRNPEVKTGILDVLYKQYEIIEKGIRGGALSEQNR